MMNMGWRAVVGPPEPHPDVVEEAEQPWGCPWCGDESFDGNDAPDYMRVVRAFDEWLEAHVTECEPWLAEQGGQ